MLWSETDEERARRGLNQALYALRQELGADEVFLGTRDLRLNPDLVTSDVAAVHGRPQGRTDLERAAAEYAGPFLDGFHLSDAPEFERWLEEERAGLARDYCHGARAPGPAGGRARGPAGGAVEWWRKLAAQDPLNARVAIGLMEALVAAGDRDGRPAACPGVRGAAAAGAGGAAGSRGGGAGRADSAAQSDAAERLPRARLPTAPASTARPVAAARPDRSGRSSADRARPAAQATEPTGGRPDALPDRAARAAGCPSCGCCAAGAPHRVGGSARRCFAAASTVRAPTRPHQPDHRRSPGSRSTPRSRPTASRRLRGGPERAAADLRAPAWPAAAPSPSPTASPGDQHWPRWSPDGSRLSFESGAARSTWSPPLGGAGAEAARVNGEGAISDEGRATWPGRPTAGGSPTPSGGRSRCGRPKAGPPRRSPTGRASRTRSPGRRTARGSPSCSATRPSSTRPTPSATSRRARSGSCRASGGPPEPDDGRRIAQHQPGLAARRPACSSSPTGTAAATSTASASSDPAGRRASQSGSPPDCRCTRSISRATAGCWPTPGSPSTPTSGRCRFPPTVPLTSSESLAADGGPPVDRGHGALAATADGWRSIRIAPGARRSIACRSPAASRSRSSAEQRRRLHARLVAGRPRDRVLRLPPGPAPPVRDRRWPAGHRLRSRRTRANQRFPDWAPDGRRLVFHSDRTGRFELYIVAREADGRWGEPHQLTSEGGQEARWSPDGRRSCTCATPGCG